jgi:epoxide hydrolase-like predicted phosphatase
LGDVVVLDFGGVLTHPVRFSIEAWLRGDRVDPASLTRLFRAWLSRDAPADNPLHLLEKGRMEEGEFTRLMAAELETVDGSEVEPEGLLARFFAGLEMDPEMVDLTRVLRSHGIKTALLSNSWGNAYPRDLLGQLFDVQVISSEVGMRKPETQIFELLAARVGSTFEELIFIDDGRPNIDKALALGMRAHLHTDAESTRRMLSHALPQLRGHGFGEGPVRCH